MIVKTTGTAASVSLGGGLTLNHPQTYDLLGEDSAWDAQDLKDNLATVEQAISDGTLELATQADHYKVYRYLEHKGEQDCTAAPLSVNFVSGLSIRLHPIHTFTRGRITQTNWYANAGVDANGELEGSDLVVREDFAYTLDAAGLARHRLQTIAWVREDESLGDTKVRQKFYDNTQARTEGRRRRRNVIDSVSISTVGLYAQTQQVDIGSAIVATTPFIEDIATELALYIEDGSPVLAQAITNGTEGWLDNPVAPGLTIRDFILGEIA